MVRKRNCFLEISKGSIGDASDLFIQLKILPLRDFLKIDNTDIRR